MVKKSFIYIVLTVFLFLASGLSWVFYTPGGAEFVLAGISRISSVKIETSEARGRLADNIFFKSIKIQMDDMSLSAGNFSLIWNPSMLLRGKIQIQEISATGFLIDDDSEEGSDIINILKQIEGVLSALSKFQTDMSLVKAENISYLEKGIVGFSADLFSFSLSFKNSILHVFDIEFKNSRLDASGSAGFSLLSHIPFVDLRIETAEPFIDYDKFSLMLSSEDMSTSGNLSINALSDEKEMTLHSNFEFDGKNMLNIETLNIAEAPGRSRLNISAEIDFDRNFSKIIARLKNLEIKTEGPYPEIDVAGVVAFELEAGRFNGSYSLENRSEDAFEALKIAGRFGGDLQAFSIDIDRALWLGGNAEGNVGIDIDKDYNINAALVLKEIDPSAAFAGYEGNISLNLEGFLRFSDDKQLSSGFKGFFADSTFLEKDFSGFFDFFIADKDIKINRLELNGAGFDITAEGALGRKLQYNINIEELGTIIPDAKGLLKAEGYLSYFEEELTGEVQATASGVEASGIGCSTFSLLAYRKKQEGLPLSLTSEVSGLFYDGFNIDKLNIKAVGDIESHTLNLAFENEVVNVAALFKGSYTDNRWNGYIDKLNVLENNLCNWSLEQRVLFSAGRESFNVESFIMKSSKDETFSIQGNGLWNPLSLNMKASWNRIDLSRAGLLLDNLTVNGHISGKAEILSRHRNNPYISLQTQAEAAVLMQNIPLSVERSSLDLTLRWASSGLESSLNVNIDNNVEIRGVFTSDEPSGFSIPSGGAVNFSWNVLELQYFKDLLPEKLEIDGQASGKIVSEIMPGFKLDMSGDININDGYLKIVQKNGIVSSKINSAEAAFFWKEEEIRGSCLVILEDHGKVNGKFSLPLQAAPPFEVYGKRYIDIELLAEVFEQGLLSSIFPDILQESGAKIDMKIRVDGSFENPSIRGSASVTDVCGYLPQTGIHIKDASMKADFKGNEIELKSLYLCSGSGFIKGSGNFYLDGAKLIGIDARLTGESFQAIYLPELQICVNPDLIFKGSSDKLKISGEIVLPSVLFAGGDTKPVIKPSADVVIMDDVGKEQEETFKENGIEIDIMIPLGDDVWIKAEGIDARLEGAVRLSIRGEKNITARGEIRVAEGTYTGGGTRLNITKGSLVFDDSRLDEPAINVLALRKIGEVKAGVQITGLVRDPIVRLYSEPSMSDTDILGYIVLGRPIGQDSGQFSMLMVAASSLLSRGEVLSLQEGIRKKFRLDVIDIEPGETEMEGSALTIGKYLNPDIYVSIGYSVFTGSSIAKIRYSLTDKWQVESNIGQESGADLFYRIELK